MASNIRRFSISLKPSYFCLALTMPCRSQWPRGLRRSSAAVHLLRSWVRIPPGAWMFFVSVVFCQVEVSATSWSFVQRSHTNCGVSRHVWSRNLVNEGTLAHRGAAAPKIKTVFLPDMKQGQIDFPLVDVLVSKFLYSDQISFRSCNFIAIRFDASVT